jgi:hypothetical protein
LPLDGAFEAGFDGSEVLFEAVSDAALDDRPPDPGE